MTYVPCEMYVPCSLNRSGAAVQGVEADDFDYTTREAFEGVDCAGFFSPAETCMLSHRILYSIKVPPLLLLRHLVFHSLCSTQHVLQVHVSNLYMQQWNRPCFALDTLQTLIATLGPRGMLPDIIFI